MIPSKVILSQAPEIPAPLKGEVEGSSFEDRPRQNYQDPASKTK
jgi:hypothetical protein